ncbi:MAG: 50S ribosomal protein L21e [Promethearchaeota archaeon]
MRKSKGYKHRHTKRLLRKKPRQRGIAPLGRGVLQKYKTGDYIDIIIDPSVHKGQPHYRFHGKTGLIKEIRGKALIISLKDGKKEKTIISRKDHVRLSNCISEK